MTVDSGEEFTVEVRGAFNNVGGNQRGFDTIHASLRWLSPGAHTRAIVERRAKPVEACRRLLLLVGIWGKPPRRRLVSHFEL
ncbi:MAG TPA: hypothetical protein VNZ53_12815 [Steroidobacteraceae bacterium]|nr:hypothetical protein [Steroidobacteraceae bacterium]